MVISKMKIKLVLILSLYISASSVSGQTLEKMNWFNEPDKWQINGSTLTMDVTPTVTTGAYLTMASQWMMHRSIMPNMAANLRQK